MKRPFEPYQELHVIVDTLPLEDYSQEPGHSVIYNSVDDMLVVTVDCGFYIIHLDIEGRVIRKSMNNQ